MPNGYTSKLFNGTKDGLDINKFIIEVAKGTKYFSGQEFDRDIYSKEELISVKNTEYEKNLVELRKELETLKHMNEEEIKQRCELYNREAIKHTRERKQENENVKARYDAMIENISKWQEKPEFSFLKNACIKILNEAKNFDCHEIPGLYSVKLQTPEEWINNQIGSVKTKIEYNEKFDKMETELFEGRKKFVEDLFDNMPGGMIQREAKEDIEKL